MTPTGPTPDPHPFGTGIARMAGMVGAAVALGLSFPLSRPTVTPTWILFSGFVGLVLLNILAFSLNLLASLPAIRAAKTEEDVERAAVPALKGEPTALGARATGILGVLVSGMLGFMAVGFGLVTWAFF